MGRRLTHMLKALFLIIAYLYGSLPVVEYLAKREGIDLRKVGTGKVGSGNLWQTTGAMNGMIGGLADLSKGAFPFLVARMLGFGSTVSSLASVAGMAGQMWPTSGRSGGGRGNSAALGLALVLSPRAFLFSITPMLAGGAIWSLPVVSQRHLPWKKRMKFRRSMSHAIPLGMVAGWAGLPLFAWLLKEPLPIVKACFVASLLLVVRRATGGLEEDRRSGEDMRIRILNRVLYDRPNR